MAILVLLLGAYAGCGWVQKRLFSTPDADRLDSIVSGSLRAGRLEEAAAVAEQSVKLQEDASGSDSLAVAHSLDVLALVCTLQHMTEKAEAQLKRALGIRKDHLAADHPDITMSYNRLAAFYIDQGKFAEAEPMLDRALNGIGHTEAPDAPGIAPPADHPDMTVAYNYLATAYTDQVTSLAKPMLEKALKAKEHTEAHTLHDAIIFHTAGTYFLKTGNLPLAERAFTAAINTYEKLPALHPAKANSAEGLALTFEAQGTYAKAEPWFVQALAINERALDGADLRVVNTLDNLALHYQSHGAEAQAGPLLIRALLVREKVLGTMHPSVATSLDNLARHFQIIGSYAAAEPLLGRATEIHEWQLRRELGGLSEARKRALMKSLQEETDSVVSLSVDEPASARALDLALTTVLRRKSRALESLADNYLALNEQPAPELRAKRNELKRHTDTRTLLDPAPQDGSRSKLSATMVDVFRRGIDTLETELNSESVRFHPPSEPATIPAIQSALPPESVLIELVRYRHVTSSPRKPASEQSRYLAYLVPAQGTPQIVPLGAAAPIDASVDSVLAAMRKDTSLEEVNAALQQLDALLLAPLRGHLTNTSHLIISPDSALNLVPFEALLDPQGHRELEDRLVSYVTSGRDLQRRKARREPRNPVTVAAAPDYGSMVATARAAAPLFSPLPGALAEATTVTAYFPEARVLLGHDATKLALAAMPGPGMLHIATHGFYARDGEAAAASQSRRAEPVLANFALPASLEAEAVRGVDIEGSSLGSSSAADEDPSSALDRAGLALAGANLGKDGILTARELAGYDWWGTQLVVLSACESGVGAAPSGDGVYGMRRALALAGAESQVVSLWRVSDAATTELMRRFYGELAQGTGRAEALRRAKLGLLAQPQFAHPYYWAAFILAGDWTPLDPKLLHRGDAGDSAR